MATTCKNARLAGTSASDAVPQAVRSAVLQARWCGNLPCTVVQHCGLLRPSRAAARVVRCADGTSGPGAAPTGLRQLGFHVGRGAGLCLPMVKRL